MKLNNDELVGKIAQTFEKYCRVCKSKRLESIKKTNIVISSLLKKSLVKKEKSTKDNRIKSFQITKKGLKIENKLKNWNKCLKDSIKLPTFEEKKNLLNFFMQKFNHLLDIQAILTCANYRVINPKAYCKLIKNHLEPNKYKYNCTSYDRKDFC